MKHAARILLVLLTGCGSSPIPDFYTLYPEPGEPARNVSLQIEIRRPGLPGYLDRPNIVRRVESGRLDISGTERWGHDLGELVGSTVARNLTQRLPESTIYTESGAISTSPDLVVEIDLQRFEATGDGVVRLDVQVALHRAGSSRAIVKRYELSKERESDDTEGMVAAMSDLLAELSEGMAESIASMGAASPSSGAATLEDPAPPTADTDPSS